MRINLGGDTGFVLGLAIVALSILTAGPAQAACVVKENATIALKPNHTHANVLTLPSLPNGQVVAKLKAGQRYERGVVSQQNPNFVFIRTSSCVQGWMLK